MIYGEKFLKHNILSESVQLVNEAYFGKTEALLELEKAIHNLRAVYDIKKNYTSTPELKAIEDAFKKQFGMDYFSFNIIPQNTVNAYTYPIGSRFDIIKNKDLSKLVVADNNNGFRFKPNNGFVIVTCIYTGLLMHPDVTDAEIVAIMLHEIGHNFADIISNDVKLANEEYYKIWWLIILLDAISSLFTTLPKDIVDTIENRNEYQRHKKEKEKLKSPLSGFLQYISGSIKDTKTNAKIVFYRIRNAFLGWMFKMDSTKDKSKKSYPIEIKTSANRQGEVIADKFASIYGYGPDIASALSKMDLYKLPSDEFLKKFPFGEAMLIQNAKMSQDYFKYDPHPHFVQRCNTMIKALEFELNKKDLDPELKSIIKDQIKDLENIKQQFMTIEKNDDEVDKIIKTYAIVVDDKYPEATTEKLEMQINKTIDDICNGKKKIK